jgi:hypothetical protein
VDSNRDTYDDGNADGHRDLDAHADGDQHRHTHADLDAHCDRHKYADTYPANQKARAAQADQDTHSYALLSFRTDGEWAGRWAA